MAFVRTMILGAVGEKSAGKPAPNNPDDVRKIQALLRKVFGPSTPALKDGVYDASMKDAISDFQRVWGGQPDATVDKHGHTLQHLDRLANPLVLKLITLQKVANGGYVIAYNSCDGGSLPPAGNGYTLSLSFRDDQNTIDVTGRSFKGLLGKDNLGQVLTIFEKLACWATPVQCRIQLQYKGATISTSDPQTLNAPIQPHNGKMLPLDEANNGPKLTYQGDADADQFYGRMFAEVAGYNKCVFIWGGNFETNNTFRGFDCITYAGTTCGASTMHMADSSDLAASLGTTPVELLHKAKDPKTGEETSVKIQLEKADPAYVKEFFAATTTGYYLMFSSGHIVIVANGEVHEFKASTPSGYFHSPVAQWLEPYKTMKLTVRKLAGKPARAT